MDKIGVFVSYSHENKDWLDEKDPKCMLQFWKRSFRAEPVEFWFDRDENSGIRGGDRWREKIEKKLDASDIAILIITQDFVISPFIRDIELPRILQRAKSGQMEILPILAEPARWRDLDLHGMFQMTPGEPTPLIDYFENSTGAWKKARLEIFESFEQIIQKVKERKGKPPGKKIENTPETEMAHSTDCQQSESRRQPDEVTQAGPPEDDPAAPLNKLSGFLKKSIFPKKTAPTTVLEFPPKRSPDKPYVSVGNLYIAKEEEILNSDHWRSFKTAEGAMEIPEGHVVKYLIGQGYLNRRDVWKKLGPDGLYALSLGSDYQLDDFFKHCLPYLSDLRQLLLYHGIFYPQNISYITKLKKLDVLIIPNKYVKTTLKDGGLRILGKLSALRRLKLSKHKITDKGLRYLSNMENLKELDLNDNLISGIGFSNLGPLRDLQSLILSGNPVETCDGLPEAFPFLKSLSLDKSKLTDAAVDPLSGLSMLEVLNLESCNISESKIEALESALPGCTILATPE